MLSTRWLLLAMIIGAVLFEATLACGGRSTYRDDSGTNGGDDGANDVADDGADDGRTNGEDKEIENNPCYNEELGRKMEETMDVNDVNSAPDALRRAGEELAPNADWQAVCSEGDFAFRNWYDGDFLCKRKAGNPEYYCLAWVDEGAK